MKNTAQFWHEILNNSKLSMTQKTLILYLVSCKSAKDTLDGIANDFVMLPSEMLRELQVLEQQGYLKIKIELQGKE